MQTHAPSGRTDSDGRARTARRPHRQRAQTAVRWLTGHPACCPTHPECKSWGTPSPRRDQRKAGVGSCRGRGSRRTCPIAGRESGSTFLSLPACVLEPGWGADQAPEGPRARLLPCGVDMGPEALCAPRPSRHKPLQHLGHPRLGSRSGDTRAGPNTQPWAPVLRPRNMPLGAGCEGRADPGLRAEPPPCAHVSPRDPRSHTSSRDHGAVIHAGSHLAPMPRGDLGHPCSLPWGPGPGGRSCLR